MPKYYPLKFAFLLIFISLFCSCTPKKELSVKEDGFWMGCGHGISLSYNVVKQQFDKDTRLYSRNPSDYTYICGYIIGCIFGVSLTIGIVSAASPVLVPILGIGLIVLLISKCGNC